MSSTIRALQLLGDRKLELTDIPAPPPPAAGEVQIATKVIALNHLDLWGFRGMAFAKRKMPQVVGVEASGEITAVGEGVTGFKAGDPVVMYGALTCGTCKACQEGRDNLCENVGGIMGFHIDGFARDRLNMPARLVIPVPRGVSLRDASCAPIGFSTVEHMLFDNAKLQPGETILVQAGGSGIGTVAIKMAKAIGCTVITTVGDDDKAEKAKAIGADHVINYRKDRFETITRKLTNKKGVDVVFEHVGGEGFNGSLLVLKRGGRLVTCGSTAGTDDHLQPDAAVPAAVQDFRLVRRHDEEHPRQPLQDGGRDAAGDRHRDRAGRARAGHRAAGKPPGVRQDRRDVLGGQGLTWTSGLSSSSSRSGCGARAMPCSASSPCMRCARRGSFRPTPCRTSRADSCAPSDRS